MVNLLAIIEAEGALVPGLGNRNGVREQAMGGRGGHRTKNVQQKQLWTHPSISDVMQELAAVPMELGETIDSEEDETEE